jgi:hypothetical protein
LLTALAIANTIITVDGYDNRRAVEEQGNIFIVGSDGSRRQVTSIGRDSDPNLASDDSKVVYVRTKETGGSDIYIAELSSESSPHAIVTTPLEINGRRFAEVFTPRFSPDSRTVYFLVPYAGTTNAIVKVTVADRHLHFITAALNFRIVGVGKYRGHIVAQIRKPKLAPGYYEWYWLLNPDGQEVGVVGEDEQDVEAFLEGQN